MFRPHLKVLITFLCFQYLIKDLINIPLDISSDETTSENSAWGEYLLLTNGAIIEI